jgi:hypothetical protein
MYDNNYYNSPIINRYHELYVEKYDVSRFIFIRKINTARTVNYILFIASFCKSI